VTESDKHSSLSGFGRKEWHSINGWSQCDEMFSTSWLTVDENKVEPFRWQMFLLSLIIDAKTESLPLLSGSTWTGSSFRQVDAIGMLLLTTFLLV
jgi:hypothetical protein